MDKEILEFLKEFKSEVNYRFDNLENQVTENTQILKALEHSAEVNKA
jgi:hypothetical protein